MPMLKRSSILFLALGLNISSLSAGSGPEPRIEVLGPFGGDVRSLAVHPERPDTFFLGTSDSQIYRSDDAGRSWRRLRPGLKRRHLVVDNLHFHPDSPDILYAGTWETKSDEGRLFISRDRGHNWAEISLGRYQMSIRAVAIAPTEPSVIAVGISEGVILSEDGGQTWRRVTRGYRSLYNVESLAFDPYDSRTLYVGTWRRGWKTNDRGKTWKPMHRGMSLDSDMFSLLVSPEDPSVLYSSACTGVWKSTNAGASWVKLRNGLPKEAKRTRSLRFHPRDAETVYAGTTIGLYKTTNAGASFKRLYPNIVVNALAVHPANPDIVLVGADDVGVLRSQDAGGSFQASNEGFTHRHISALAASPSRRGTYYAAVASDGGHGGFFATRDDGGHWEQFNDGLGSAASSIRAILPAADSAEVLLRTGRGLFRGVPGERPWAALEPAKDLRIEDMAWSSQDSLILACREGLYLMDIDSGRVRRLDIPVYEGPAHTALRLPGDESVMAGTDMGVFISADQGRSWTIKVHGLPYAPVRLLRASAAGVVYAATDAGLFMSSDAGGFWAPVEGLGQEKISDLVIHPADPRSVFAADLSFGHLYQRPRGEGQWRRIPLDRISRLTSLVAAPDGALLAGTVTDGLCRIDFPVQAVQAGSQ